MLSKEAEGQQTGEEVSNIPTLTSGNITTEMGLHSIILCSEYDWEEDDDDLVGI